ncbi:MAG: glycoside hydrolase family 97 N-terminal domain-containing protein, partial [Ginsengibacter sp.]
MLLKKIVFVLTALLFLTPAIAKKKEEFFITMNKVKVSFMLDEKGTPLYTISYSDKPVIKPSQMGFIFSNNDNFNSGFELTGSDKNSVDETWKPVWGEVSSIRNHYEQVIFHLKQTSTKRLLDIDFKVYEDGVGFRYEFPLQPNL